MFYKLSFPAFLFAGLALVLALTSGCSTNTPTPPPKSSDAAEKAKNVGNKRMELKINDVEYAFRLCPAGTFMMGSPASEPGRYDTETQHQVKLSHDFWMLETEVTQAMWEGVMGSNPSHFKGSKLPVECVSWNDCQEYIKKLNDLGVAPKGYRFSLPTEAQWEYACRAGTATPYHFGNTLNKDQANFSSNVVKTSEVSLYPANAWGLHDMHGNVCEWCSDWYGDYPDEAVIDPTGIVKDKDLYRVLRGGLWYAAAKDCRSALRSFLDPSVRGYRIGLRVSLGRVGTNQYGVFGQVTGENR